MGNVIDLSIFANETLEVTMPTGETIHVKKPTQKITIRMMEMQKTLKQCAEEPEKMFAAINKMLVDILEHNTEGKKYSIQYFEDSMSIAVANALLSEYMSFTSNIQNQKN